MTSIEDIKREFKKWLYLEDTHFIDVVMAVAIAEQDKGEPLWLFLIAPPGSTKTETIRSFAGDLFYSLDDLTSHTFICGLRFGKKDMTNRDLLPQLNKRVLLIKDFTTILEKNLDERKDILGQLRAIYDGYYEKKFGTKAGKVGYKSRFGIIAGVTPVIDKYWKVMQQLGERFLKCRIKIDSIRAAEKAYDNSGNEEPMRKAMQSAVKEFIDGIDFKQDIIFPDEKYKRKLIEMANLLAVSRTPVSRSSKDQEFEYIPEPELPTRLIKQLKRLAICLARVHGKDEVGDEEIAIVKRVCLDTIPQDRLAVMREIAKGDYEAEEIATAIKMPVSSTRFVIDDLWKLGLVSKDKVAIASGGYEYVYKLRDNNMF